MGIFDDVLDDSGRPDLGGISTATEQGIIPDCMRSLENEISDEQMANCRGLSLSRATVVIHSMRSQTSSNEVALAMFDPMQPFQDQAAHWLGVGGHLAMTVKPNEHGKSDFMVQFRASDIAVQPQAEVSEFDREMMRFQQMMKLMRPMMGGHQNMMDPVQMMNSNMQMMLSMKRMEKMFGGSSDDDMMAQMMPFLMSKFGNGQNNQQPQNGQQQPMTQGQQIFNNGGQQQTQPNSEGVGELSS
ncbi:hypothetical protein OAU50_02760 [Planctomycetota bacterium]|nr:hypothetical protein [Planctomycetota bacterium]